MGACTASPKPGFDPETMRAVALAYRRERQAGQLSKQLDKSKGGNPTHRGTRGTAPRVPTKAEQRRAAGISPDQAKDWEKLAGVPEDTDRAY
jgi:hypothetical protein